MYNVKYDVKIFNQIVSCMKSVEPYNGYSEEMAILRRILDEGIDLTPEYLDSITTTEIEDMIELIGNLANESDSGLIQEMSNVSSAKMSLASISSNKNAVLTDEDFF